MLPPSWYDRDMFKLSLPAGSMVRNRANQRAYDDYRRRKSSATCQFCEFSTALDYVLAEYPLFWVVRNIFPYHIWDGSRTGEHLLIVPKRHIDSIGHFTRAEKTAYIDLIAEYEAKGYSIYSRAAQNGRKSVVHQHTHLIEVGKGIKAQLFIQKPHVNLTR